MTDGIPGATSPRALLASTAAVTTVCVLPSFLLGAMAVQVGRDLDFAESGVGIAFAAFFAAASIASAPLGRVTERGGPVRSLRLAACVSGASCLAVAAGARSFATLVVPIGVAGASNALCQPAANLLIARALPVSRQGFAFAVKQSAIPASTLVAGAAVPAVALTVGWRWAFVGAGIASFLTAALVPTRLPAPPVHPADERPGPDTATAGDATELAPEQAEDVPVRIMARLALGIGFGAAAGGTLGSFLVSAAVDGGLSEGGAGLVLTGGSLAGIGVRLVAGIQADRRTGGHLVVVARMLLAGAVAFALLATTLPVAYVVAGPLAFCTAWAWPGLFNLAVVRANPRRPAAATSVTQTGTYIGAVSGPVVFGLIADASSYRLAWSAAVVFSVAAAIAMISARRALLAWRTPP